MKHFFLFVVLLLATLQVAAQVSSRAARPDSLTAPLAATPAAPDTMAAIHRLFVHKRRLCLVVLGANLGLGTASYLDGIHSNDPVGVGLTYILVAPIFAATTLGILLGSAQYSHRREVRVLRAFEVHQLPQRIKAQLKPRYFR
ncbi:hypothetical protein GKZ68_10580 [Hymenobacter sp. BRD128]|uniref:hypothetical protein n=1 Tax=Hymenobacter sp. BRD128 TaxID=2675878 RepID=UPI001564EB6D|nr:hypothetical protein [Hymenobacter sp. BRD128]QKG57034.1 hypothetical protein GKZ68_10580 [Hymenobacter sp. BRD128]